MDNKHDSDPRDDPQLSRGGVLLMRTWDDGEAEMVRRLLEVYEIPCQVVSDIPHTVFPLTVDGLGEVRILVTETHFERAQALIAEHRRHGFQLVDDEGGEDAETDATPKSGTEE